jgi:hypothetical protein
MYDVAVESQNEIQVQIEGKEKIISLVHLPLACATVPFFSQNEHHTPTVERKEGHLYAWW